MLSDFDVCVPQRDEAPFGDHAELQAARYADLCSDTAIGRVCSSGQGFWRTIAEISTSTNWPTA